MNEGNDFSMGGGYDKSWMTPLDPEGNIVDENYDIMEHKVGCHTGKFEGLNVVNPKPGYEYMWLLNPTRAGADPGDWFAIQSRQAEIVKSEDPEFRPYHAAMGEAGPSFMDTSFQFRELVLCRIPQDVMRKEREEQVAENARQLRKGPSEEFAARATAIERELYSTRGPTRFQEPEHQTEFQADGRTVEIHKSDTGILRQSTRSSSERTIKPS